MDTKKIVGNLDLIRRINRSLVLETIRADQPISRAQIARRLNLSKTTVTVIVNDFLERKLVYEFEEPVAPEGGGRPAVMLGFNPQSAYGVGVDIGGTKIKVIITDLDGEIVLCRKTETTNQLEEIASLVTSCLQEVGLSEQDVIGMGIGVPGTTQNGTVFQAKSLGWEDFDLRNAIAPMFPFPIFIGNDVNFAALGERWLGAGDRSDNMVFIAIGTGIGSAFICDGTLVLGAENRVGEICYLIDRNDYEEKRFNVFGKVGIFEEKVSGMALSRHRCSPEELFGRYAASDAEAISIIDDFVVDLSIGIANIVSLLNPEVVVIGGGVSESMSVVIDDIQQIVARLTPIKTNVRLASLGGKAGALGAIDYTFEQLEQS